MMAKLTAVPDPLPDPKIGKKRTFSGIVFPYYNLKQSIEAGKTIYQAGGELERPQLASLLGYSGVDNGSYLSRVTAAKIFGIVEQVGNKLRITPLGKNIVAPISEADAAAAKVKAFLGVDLFRKIFEEYNGIEMPGDVGLQNLLKDTHKVVENRLAPTVKILIDSADQAGFFKVSGNRRKMLMPIASSAATGKLPSPPADLARTQDTPRHGGNGTGGGRGDGGWDGASGSDIHPAILGLLNDLPRAGSTLTLSKRASLIAAFTAMVNWIYPEEDAT